MRIRALLVIAVAALSVAACGDDDVAGTGADAGSNNEFRPEIDPPTPPNTGSPNSNTSNNNDNTSNNNTSNNDTPDAGNSDMGAGMCDGLSECDLQATRCAGAQLQVCEDDGDGDQCGEWSTPAACPSPQQVCADGMCVTDSDCIDNDNDGYGANCAAGPDCDDNDGDRFPGNPEVCDGIDNDCNAGPDDVDGLGGTCTSGTGACMATGTPSCNGTDLVCNATNPTGSPEVCDTIDNDCDGQVDEGNVCNMMCAADSFEPNDTAMTAAMLTVNTTPLAMMCGTNDDWYDLPTQNNNTYRILATFPNHVTDIDMEIYENGSLLSTSDGIGDVEGFTLTAQPNSDYSIRVYNAGSADSYYNLQFVDTIQCVDEDAFAPNQTLADATYFGPNWITEAYACNGSRDFYWMGELQSGSTVTINTYDIDIVDDLDLFLWADPDGDGTFTVVDQSTSSNSNETITHTTTHTGDFYYEVRDFGGLGAYYDMQWTN